MYVKFDFNGQSIRNDTYKYYILWLSKCTHIPDGSLHTKVVSSLTKVMPPLMVKLPSAVVANQSDKSVRVSCTRINRPENNRNT